MINLRMHSFLDRSITIIIIIIIIIIITENFYCFSERSTYCKFFSCIKIPGETAPLCCVEIKLETMYVARHKSINDLIKAYKLHCFLQRLVAALVLCHLQVDYLS